MIEKLQMLSIFVLAGGLISVIIGLSMPATKGLLLSGPHRVARMLLFCAGIVMVVMGTSGIVLTDVPHALIAKR